MKSSKQSANNPTSVTGDTSSEWTGRTNEHDQVSDSPRFNLSPLVLSQPVAAGQGPRKLHLGCGFDVWTDAMNVDITKPAHYWSDRFKEADLDSPYWNCIFPQAWYTDIHAYHLIEHLSDTYRFMAQVYEIAANNATFTLRCPYGSSDDAWGDQTHVRPMFIESFQAFSQQYHWRSDVGYKADWQPTTISLIIPTDVWDKFDDLKSVWDAIVHQRNIVQEMVVVMRAVKPSRVQQRGVKPEFEQPTIQLVKV